MQPIINCQHYIKGDCRSCQWLEKDYAQQLQEKMHDLTMQLSAFPDYRMEPTCASKISGFRNKAKMIVSGSVERPILGILPDHNNPQSAVDLSDCPLYPASLQAIFPILKDFIGRAGLVPYNILKRKGELKYILLTESQSTGKMMLRFVLRSELKLPLIQRELPSLLAKLPQLEVVSLNIQPQHAAILEGEKEIFLTEQQVLAESFNQIPLFIRPQGFFQTNPVVAEKLYHTAQEWVLALNVEYKIQHLWDLFCGVGGFGLHCASALQKENPAIKLTGIEISPSAIFSATLSANKLALPQVNFQSLDAAAFALQQKDKPDLIVVNPPRRGIGGELAEFLNQLRPHFILYSSCNSQTMAKDMQYLSAYQLEKTQLFDMFPHTSHYEVLSLLKIKKA